jgi:hypothetical protein
MGIGFPELLDGVAGRLHIDEGRYRREQSETISVICCRVSLIAAVVFFCLTGSMMGQSPSGKWSDRLVGKPMYLRGFWSADRLDFDGTGKLLSASPVGPVTLSGVDVTSVEMKGQSLIVHGNRVHGNRVALVAQGDGTLGLERRVISSTTQIWPSLRRGDKNKFHAAEELTITMQPGSSGDFEAAITGIFAEGLAQLANAVPIYWKCYAANYFVPTGRNERHRGKSRSLRYHHRRWKRRRRQ